MALLYNSPNDMYWNRTFAFTILHEKKTIFKLLYHENKKSYRNETKYILKLKVDAFAWH